MVIKQIYPMLAHKKDVEKLGLMTDSMWVGQEKYDGERVIWQIYEAIQEFTGRRPGKHTGLLAVKTEHVPHLHMTEELRKVFDGTILDGELIHPEYYNDIKLGFKKLSAVMRSLPDKAIKRQEEEGFLHYHVYDILAYKGRDLRQEPYSVRLRHVEKFFKEYTELLEDSVKPPILQVQTFYDENKDLLLETVLTQGKEGIMLRYLGGKYEENKKSHHLIKVKDTCEIDAVVLHFDEAKMPYTGKEPETWLLWGHPETLDKKKIDGGIPGEGMYRQTLQERGYIPVSYSWFYDLPGAVVFGCYRDGKMEERGQCSGFDYETAYDMRDHPENWIGEVIEVEGYGFMPSGKIRHPQFGRKRYDKSPEECVWE